MVATASPLRTTPALGDERPLPPGLSHRQKVGMVLSFTGHYDSVRLLQRFLHHAGFDVVTSRTSTAPIIEAGTALASSDFCFPLRVYVGHVYDLAQRHPDLEAIVAPNVWSERPGSATCAKYRDVGGIAVRSLGGVVPHLKGRHLLPRLVQPDIKTLDYGSMRNAAFDTYAALLRLPARARLALFLPAGFPSPWTTHLRHVDAAFRRAWRDVMERPQPNPAALLADPALPRVALVGRRYLVHDHALSADLKPWFSRHGVAVVTASDVPWAELEDAYRRVDGFYDTHREGQAFIEWAADKVDGFIVVGSFGCHPDAFQVDYLADFARARGKPAWTFRFDETAGNTGFQTRFETILGFLQQQRDLRLKRSSDDLAKPPAGPQPDAAPATRAATLRPLFVWPYMGEELNLVLDEVLVQVGLRDIARPPRPVDGSTLTEGNRRYTESCCPFAFATGSLMQSVRETVAALRREAEAAGVTPEPRRIMALMLRGEGPCTFGWYAIAQNRHLPLDLAPDLADGHRLELLTMGLDNAASFLRDLAALGNTRRLDPVIRYVEARMGGSWRGLPAPARLLLTLRFQLAVRALLGPVWAKLAAAEHLRARSLVLRAHEVTPGAVAQAYREVLDGLRQAHTRHSICVAVRRGLHRLNAVPRDRLPKPRVVSVGEIYVALTSFANRGVVENLLGREGIEVVEGITLSGFIHHSLRVMRRRSLANHSWVRPLRLWLAERNLHWLAPRVRDPRARPFLRVEVGGEGMFGVAAARSRVERGCDGILHTYPFKCMPEGIAKDAYKELGDLYGVRYLGLSFDKELEMERARTEVSTFAALLRAQMEGRRGRPAALIHGLQRRLLGLRLNRLYRLAQRGTHRG